MNGELRDRFDEQIDAAASEMVKAQADADLTRRIVEALPERRGAWPWRLRSVQAAVVVGVAGLAIAVLPRPGGQASDPIAAVSRDPAAGPLGSSQTNAPDPPVATLDVVSPAAAVQRRAIRREAASRTVEPPRIHDFDLASIPEPELLTVGALEPVPLAVPSPVLVAPMELPELPIASDASRFDKE